MGLEVLNMSSKKKFINKYPVQTDMKSCKSVTEGFRFKGASKAPVFHPPVEIDPERSGYWEPCSIDFLILPRMEIPQALEFQLFVTYIANIQQMWLQLFTIIPKLHSNCYVWIHTERSKTLTKLWSKYSNMPGLSKPMLAGPARTSGMKSLHGKYHIPITTELLNTR